VREWIESGLGAVDFVAAFAGSGSARPGPVHELSEEEWHSTVDGNLTATFLTLKTFLPGMIERRAESIVTMASLAVVRRRRPLGRVRGSQSQHRHAHVASQVGQYGVRVNCLSPSTVLTERTSRQMSDEVKERFTTLHPLGRLGEPRDVAEAACFLASDNASWLTGVVLDVAGGAVMV
jgi:3-oxoacyl-[acyl-carrier protein] reductase